MDKLLINRADLILDDFDLSDYVKFRFKAGEQDAMKPLYNFGQVAIVLWMEGWPNTLSKH